MILCKHCNQGLEQDDHKTYISLATGGDVCGFQGGNEPHVPQQVSPLFVLGMVINLRDQWRENDDFTCIDYMEALDALPLSDAYERAVKERAECITQLTNLIDGLAACVGYSLTTAKGSILCSARTFLESMTGEPHKRNWSLS